MPKLSKTGSSTSKRGIKKSPKKTNPRRTKSTLIKRQIAVCSVCRKPIYYTQAFTPFVGNEFAHETCDYNQYNRVLNLVMTALKKKGIKTSRKDVDYDFVDIISGLVPSEVVKINRNNLEEYIDLGTFE